MEADKAAASHRGLTHQVGWRRLQSRTQRQQPAHPSQVGWELCQPVGAGYDLSTCNPPCKGWGASLVGSFLKVLQKWEDFLRCF